MPSYESVNFPIILVEAQLSVNYVFFSISWFPLGFIILLIFLLVDWVLDCYNFNSQCKASYVAFTPGDYFDNLKCFSYKLILYCFRYFWGKCPRNFEGNSFDRLYCFRYNGCFYNIGPFKWGTQSSSAFYVYFIIALQFALWLTP